MIRLSLSSICEVLDLPRPECDVTVESVATDSRKVRYGSLFAALEGERVDGHEFTGAAVSTGAVALLVRRPVDAPVPQLVVEDVLKALGRIARLVRDTADPVVVGITGSNGKTTVKEMVSAILRQNGPVLATEANYNNELGVPLTLFRLETSHRHAVLEMGASRAGDIEYLGEIAHPDIGLVTNIGPAHLEGFGDIEGVARAKGEMFAALPAAGCAVINADEPWRELWQSLNRAGRTLSFGTGADADVRVSADGDVTCLETPVGECKVKLSLPGAHNRLNAAAAAAVAVALDVPLADIRDGLESVGPVPGRLNLISTKAGWTVIDDTYNANPASLYSALRVLAGMQGKAWLVLGDMKELGEDSRKLHAEVGDAARSLGVARLFALGEMSASTADAFGAGAEHFDDRNELVGALRAALRPGINCLVKGSRSMGMEQVVQAITESADVKEAC
ncbi:UDP-N-acetylmuramoyl-tripeptide--D-alanyl-D-alanine ligase [Elongatibacter sediminis]|uniref:UDP-N-acetylmuramoyl-tripeptide--D-alanyl-D-alanine ligase n=1 Tax=Elongatibacter sediminis TaxID=3119006 RepID=A0AAW9RII4_9GAMM